MKKLIFMMKKFNNKDLTKIIYPIIIFITGWYTIANVCRLLIIGHEIAYTIVWALIPIGFTYIALKGIKLKFRWSILSVIGILLIIVFLHEAISLFLDPNLNLLHIFFTGQWDHTFFPIAFGLFFLCDLNKIPKKFWVFLLPFAIFCLMPNLNVVSNILYDSWFQDGPPGFFTFFGVESMAEISALSQQEFVHGLTEYLHEQLTFFSLFPIVIFYYLIKKKS